MAANIESLLYASSEVVNYANYEANDIVEISKYISEKPSGVANSIARATGMGEKVLLISPTGSGKTYSIINNLKSFKVKALFILPNSANVEQVMGEYDIHGAYDNICPKGAINKGDVVVMTWDKVSQLTDIDLKDHIIVIDEVHQTYTDTYRNKVIKGLYEISSKCKGRIDITATPSKLDFSIYDYIVEYKQTKQTKYNLKMYRDININKIIDIINKSNNSALLLNDTKELKFISSKINKSSDVITSETKEHSKLYDNIMKFGSMGDFKTLLNTTTIVAGVNVKNSNITDIILVGIKDIGTIKQYIARFRDLKECNVHLFNSYKEECNIYDVEWLVNENIRKASIIKDSYNIACNGNTEFSTLGLNINPINLDTNIFFNKDTNSYEVDEIYIRSQVYKKYYNSRTLESFKYLLGEYFDNIEILEVKEPDPSLEDNKNHLKEYKKDLKEAKEEAINILNKHKKILVGYSDIKKDNKPFNLMEYQIHNKLTMEQCQKDYLKYNIHNLILNNSLKSMINLYSKNVLENNLSINISWRLANMGNRKRGSIFAKINTLIYKELKTEYPNVFKNDYSLEVRAYEFIIKEFKEGISYTNEHLENLAEAFNMVFGDNWALTPKKLGDILNQIYVIDKVKNKKLTQVETLFYRNIIPTQVKNDKLNYNTIKSKVDINAIKKELVASSSDKSLENYISNKKQNILNQLDSTEKEILLEGIF
ncbi:MAG: DEAD/DEAH box helicase family protein [Paraclostridium sp.]